MICYTATIKEVNLVSGGGISKPLFATGIPSNYFCFGKVECRTQPIIVTNFLIPTKTSSNVIIGRTTVLNCFLSGNTKPCLIAKI